MKTRIAAVASTSVPQGQCEDNTSTEIDEAETREFGYYMMRQAKNSVEGLKPRGGVKVRGQSTRKPSGRNL